VNAVARNLIWKTMGLLCINYQRINAQCNPVENKRPVGNGRNYKQVEEVQVEMERFDLDSWALSSLIEMEGKGYPIPQLNLLDSADRSFIRAYCRSLFHEDTIPEFDTQIKKIVIQAHGRPNTISEMVQRWLCKARFEESVLFYLWYH
jgi:hypothetical protein